MEVCPISSLMSYKVLRGTTHGYYMGISMSQDVSTSVLDGYVFEVLL